MASSSLPLLPGTVDVLVLASLQADSRHGYDVAEWIRVQSAEALQIDDGALYTALHRLEKRGLLEATWGMSESNRRAKYYRLTPDGRRTLERESRQWARYASAMFSVLGDRLNVDPA